MDTLSLQASIFTLIWLSRYRAPLCLLSAPFLSSYFSTYSRVYSITSTKVYAYNAYDVCILHVLARSILHIMHTKCAHTS